MKTTITVYSNASSDYVNENTNRLNDRLNENEILRKQNNQNKEEQEEKKSNLKNLSDEDFDLMLEEMLKERKERKRNREKDFECKIYYTSFMQFYYTFWSSLLHLLYFCLKLNKIFCNRKTLESA